MGVVYLAHDLKHDRAVAIKVLRSEVAALLGRERFLREIGIAAQLSHPHIVPLHDSGEADGLLYYVMPFVPGETLRERLDRAGPLPVDEAIGITRQVATALAHAHGRGVIHRDIKPSNILLSEGFALVADFGLARALSSATASADISSIGLPVGTPRYMSPEQAMGAPSVDGRSDLFSLGCVLREMLVGPPAKEGESEGRSDPGARLSAVRPEIPAAVQRMVIRCLAPDPANRYATAQELIAVLEGHEPGVRGRRWAIPGAVTVLVVLVALALWRAAIVAGPGGGGLDSTRFVVLPFERLTGAPELQADLPVRAELARWTGITVVAGVQVNEALKGLRSGDLDRGVASGIARRLGAGRFVRGQVVPLGDSVQVEAVLYDSRDGTALVQKTVRLPLNLAGADSIVPKLADSLLFRGAAPTEHFVLPPGTTSAPAFWAFIRGREAVAGWDLATADSGFARALAIDPTFARAALWLAQVRAWQGQPSSTWRSMADQAAAGGSRLGSRDFALAQLTAMMAREEYGTACPSWLGLTRQWPGEFPVWYGAAICLSRDRGVKRDSHSPTGWKFRSSYHQAQLAWRHAFALMSAIYRDFRAGGIRGTQWLLWTAANRGRYGSAVPPDTGFFLSYPIWQGDTMAFLPRPMAEYSSGRVVRPWAIREAVIRQRLAFYELATEWSSANPQSLEPREAVALALWSLGNPAAIDSIRATRATAVAPRDRVRLGVSQVLMMILRGVSDPAEVRAARVIADSALALGSAASDIDPWDLATLAALTGRATAAAKFARLASPQTAWTLPPALGGDALAFLVLAALGGPADSLVALEARVSDGIATGVAAEGQQKERREWLGRPLALVALDVSLPSLKPLSGTGDYLIDAEAAQLSGDTATVWLLLRGAAASRSVMQPSDLTFEGVYPEARLLAAMGDRQAAIGRLDPTLADLRHSSLQVVSHPLGAGLLVRAMAFRADLAAAVGDSANARRWSQTVSTLWSEADPFLAPLVQRMRRLIRSETH